MGIFESFIQNMAQLVGGGEDPKPKSAKPVYTSQEQINKGNAFARDFLERHGAPQYFINNSVVARKVGDPIPQFIGQGGTNADRQPAQTKLPSGVSVNDVFQNQDKQYGYIHPQNGNWVQVDPQAIYSNYKK